MPSTLIERIEEDLKHAIKGDSDVDATTVRQLLASLKNEQIRLKKETLTEEETESILTTEMKKRREAVDLYSKGDRNDLKEKEEREMAYISTFLPEQLGDEEIRTAVDTVIGRQSDPSVGSVMGEVMKELKGKADGNRVRSVVENALSG